MRKTGGRALYLPASRGIHPRVLLAFSFLLLCLASDGQTSANQSGTTAKSAVDYDIAMHQKKIAEDPGYFGNYDSLTFDYIRKARETGDTDYYTLAEQTLQAEEKSTHPDKSMLLSLKATLHFAKHDFDQAAADAEKAVLLDPEDEATYATIGDANLERGEYDKALADYMKLSIYKESDYPHSMLRYDFKTRIAHYKFIVGDSRGSIADLREAGDILESVSLGKETRAWTDFILAEELLLAGDLSGSESATQASLHHLPAYHRALAEMGKIRAAQRRFPEAIDYYKQAIAVVPLPIYVAALGDLYTRQGNAQEAEKQFNLVEFIAQLSALNKVVYNRELALFLADHGRRLPEALTLARNELKIRHDVYTWDTLAWVLAKNGLGPEAVSAAEKATQFNTPDPLIFFHAGVIYSKFGDKQKGRLYLEKALALNPQFHPIYADQARAELNAERPAMRAGNAGADLMQKTDKAN